MPCSCTTKIFSNNFMSNFKEMNKGYYGFKQGDTILIKIVMGFLLQGGPWNIVLATSQDGFLIATTMYKKDTCVVEVQVLNTGKESTLCSLIPILCTPYLLKKLVRGLEKHAINVFLNQLCKT